MPKFHSYTSIPQLQSFTNFSHHAHNIKEFSLYYYGHQIHIPSCPFVGLLNSSRQSIVYFNDNKVF